MKKFVKKFIIFVIVVGWIFNYPLWQFSLEIQKAHALVQWSGSGTFTSGAGSITPPYPTSMKANDVCLLAVSSENEAISLTTANGFVEVPVFSPQSAGTAASNPASRLAVFWKRTVGGDSDPVVADSGNNTEGVIHCFSGVVTSGTPWDTGAGGNDAAADDTTGNVPGSTTSVANTLVVLINSTSFNGTSAVQFSGWTNADLANLTERQDNSNTAGLGGGSGMATGEKVTAGAYTTTTVTLANTSFKGAISLALKPNIPTLDQVAYRWFQNTNSANVDQSASINTPITMASSSRSFRLRILLHATDNIVASGTTTKLQIAERSGTCDTSFTGETFSDVSSTTGRIRFFDNPGVADGATLTSNKQDPRHGTTTSHTVQNQVYSEGAFNLLTNSVAATNGGQDMLFDFALVNNSSPERSSYCFRMVQFGGEVFSGTYNVISELTTDITPNVKLRDVRLRQVRLR